MTGRRLAIAAAVLLNLFALSLAAEGAQQMFTQPPTPQARQQLTKALQEFREKKDRQGEALTLLQLGITEAGLANVAGARSNLTEAVEKMRAQNDPVGAWLALLLLSQIESALGRSPEAIAHLEKALALLNETKAPNAPFTLKTFLAFGSVSGPPEMFQMLEGSNASMLKVPMIQYSFEPMTRDLYGSALTQAGQLEKAESELKAAVAGAIYAQGMYDFSLESHFGDLRFRQQRYDEARGHYMKALNASSKASMLPMGGEEQIRLGIYDRLSRLETITGHPDEAARWSGKARELARKRLEGR